MGVEERQFVAHLCTLWQKTLSLEREPALGQTRSAPYRRMGATRDVASLWHRYGASAVPGGLWRLIGAKAPWARASRQEQSVDMQRVGVNQ